MSSNHAGMRIPEPDRKGKNNFLSLSYGTKVVRAANAFLNLIVRAGKENRLHIADGNAVLELIGGAGGGPNAAPFSRYRPKTVESEHYVCRLLTVGAEGEVEGDTDILIARPFEHRNSILSETIDGQQYVYTYGSTTERVSTGPTTETEQIVPHILLEGLEGDTLTTIIAAAADTGVTVDGQVLTLIDINVAGRAWARIAGP